MPCLTFPPLLSPNVNTPQERPEPGGLTKDIGFNVIKTERYNMQDTNWMDLNKIDIIQPAPKRLCTKTLKGCSYCKFNTECPSTTPSDWFSKDWDGKKAKSKEQR